MIDSTVSASDAIGVAMDQGYNYASAQCDVSDKRKLQAFRDKKRLWTTNSLMSCPLAIAACKTRECLSIP